jgi:hypothetical protein
LVVLSVYYNPQQETLSPLYNQAGLLLQALLKHYLKDNKNQKQKQIIK